MLQPVSSETQDFQQFPLGTAGIASCFYPALGGADARNEGGGAKLSPPSDPPSGREFSAKIIFLYEEFIIYFIYLNPFYPQRELLQDFLSFSGDFPSIVQFLW